MPTPVLFLCCLFFYSCTMRMPPDDHVTVDSSHQNIDTIQPKAKEEIVVVTDTTKPYIGEPIDTKNISRTELITFAKQLIGVPYKYASTDPAQGFDCSGFISFVFNHFNIAVPRSSVDFTNVGLVVDLKKAQQGDLILFTGTDSTVRVVGHMGIVTENSDSLRFIHSTSGKANGVTITALNNYYMGRFVKVIKVFKD